jgi:hypothetical protein
VRRAADSVTPGNEPPGFDIYLGYDDGVYQNVTGLAVLLPHLNPAAKLWAVTVFARDDEGDWLDVEWGDATAAQAPGWVSKRRGQGHPNPGVYTSEANWQNCRDEFARQGVPEPIWWIAGYPGSVGPRNIYPGAVGHQWVDWGPYDESVFANYIPGLDDPAPAPGPAGGEEDMGFTATDPQSGLVIATDADGNFYGSGIGDLKVTTLTQHPDWHAGSAASGGQNPCIGITPWKDPDGKWGYCYITRPASGTGGFGPYDLYHIGRDGTPH